MVYEAGCGHGVNHLHRPSELKLESSSNDLVPCRPLYLVLKRLIHEQCFKESLFVSTSAKERVNLMQ